MIVFIYTEQYIISVKENIISQDSNEMFNYTIIEYNLNSIKNYILKY
jgi:hypothetical protein